MLIEKIKNHQMWSTKSLVFDIKKKKKKETKRKKKKRREEEKKKGEGEKDGYFAVLSYDIMWDITKLFR